MLDPGIVVTRITEDRRIAERDTIVRRIRVEFMVDKHGPFLEDFDKDGYTAEVRDAKLNTFAREVRTT